MADTLKISELTEISTIDDSAYMVVDDGTTTNKITVENFNETATASAQAYAEAAAASAEDASDYADTCQTISTNIEGYVSTAEDAATNASTYASNASASASSASGYSSTASTAATNASNYANNASTYASNASNYATLSESWCQGGTGARSDEATNNCAYWASVCETIAGGGVLSFNGRGGIVAPESGDYEADMITYDNTDSGLAATDTQAAIDELADEKQDALSFDAAPASGSSNPVTSDGIYSNTVSAVSGATGTSEGQVQVSVTAAGTTTATDMTVNGWDSLVGVWTSTVSALTGATTASFTNPFSTTSIAFDPYCENSSGTPYGVTAYTVTSSTITITFDELEEDTDFKLLVKDLS